MYRAPTVPEPDTGPDAESVADELRERARSLERWLTGGSVALALAVCLPMLWLFVGEGGSWSMGRVVYVLVAIAIAGGGRALGRHAVRRATHRWVAKAEREHRLDGADIWRRIWAGYY